MNENLLKAMFFLILFTFLLFKAIYSGDPSHRPNRTFDANIQNAIPATKSAPENNGAPADLKVLSRRH